MMKRATLLCFLALSPLVAERCCFDGFFYAGGEALYWKPCACNFSYATVTTFDPPGRTDNASGVESKSVKPDYDWGFRIFGGYEGKCDDFFGMLDWTYLRTSDTGSVSANNQGQPQILLPLVQSTTSIAVRSARAKLKYDYDRVNVRIGYYLYKGCWGEFYSYGGVRYLRLKQERKMHIVDVTPNVIDQNDHSKFEGAALEFGIGGEYAIACGFNIVGHAGVIAGVGDQSLGGQLTTDRTGLLPKTSMSAKGGTHCIPGVELRLGINYAFQCGCMDIVGEIGYELDHYFNALTVFDLNASSPAGSASAQQRAGLLTKCEDVGFGGPYISLALYF